ncbi:MAG: PhoH family protein [Oceanospirillales bacterium]|uniref:PhoH-like ATPase n=1 Tax=Marinobacterium halophilum TaxID=267374 RepID=A0A2P8EUY6_9GAMM|nr:PhoH family protein [Marinobacterium halophilum]MBR9827353.1 PhoH family protein [Oceanospirillales bacterium]PSL13264.1 PhoH-like ATPase [Marinobacterium halophilum]
MPASKLYILDTNVLLHDPKCLFQFKEQDITIPMTVLEELDGIKDRKQSVAAEARHAIRVIDNILSSASNSGQITKGVRILLEGKEREHKLGKLSIFPDHELTPRQGFLPDTSNKDNRIINCALHLQATFPHRQIVLVTKDINMRLKALGAGLQRVEDYRTDQLVSDIEMLPAGHHHLEAPFWEGVDKVDSFQRDGRTYHKVDRNLLPNTYLNEYIYDDSKDFAARTAEIDETTLTLLDLGYERLMDQVCWGIQPINIQQAFAMQSLMDPEIDLSILLGAAGSGKTLIALACALEMVIEEQRFNKIIVTRSTPPVAEDIGFLPGTEEEKMTPWMSSINDNLEAMHEQDERPQSSVKYALEKANIQFKSLNFIRGRSIQNAIVLIDEAQNLTPQQLKTIITRCGKGTKMVCLGNLAQIDSNYLTPLTSGLTYIVERFRNFEGSASVHFEGIFRSRLAEYAEEHL